MMIQVKLKAFIVKLYKFLLLEMTSEFYPKIYFV